MKVVDTHGDLMACLALRKAVFVAEQGVPLDLEVDELDTIGAALHVLAQHGTDPTALATARVKPCNNQSAKVQRVAVARNYRNTGLGRQLMHFVEQVCRDQGYTMAVLDAQLTAEGFYQKLGYRRTSDEIFLDAGIEHVHMEKPLLG